ncbi:hypothetical protein SK128_018166 [Halocaridina rubra]|uniref:Transmembrane protein 177 n=1 Tax=Halocaridina rubra TaxID=373956 RepID=A0AAN8ZY20_HALRR
MSWFLKPTGRRVMKAVAFSGMASGFLMYYLPNSYFTEQYELATQLHKDGIPVRLPKNILPLVEAALNDIDISKAKQSLIFPYIGYGFDIFHAGSTLLSRKCVLGLPISFKYSNFEDFDVTGIVVNNEPVPWSSPEGKSLQQSLILSDDAKKFAIARELVHIDSSEPILKGVFTSSVMCMCYIFASTVNKRLNFYARPRNLRLCFYTLVSCFGYAFWALGNDLTCVSNEASADETVANISETYARGGLEFYEKILQRNIALRSLIKDRGEALYTAFGNDRVLLRTRHMAFSERRDYMKTRLQNYGKCEEVPKISEAVQVPSRGTV